MRILNRILVILAVAALPEMRAAEGAPAAAPVPLRRLVLAETLEQGNALRDQPGDAFLVVADSLRFIDIADLEKRLIGGRGQQITEPLLVAINQIVEGVVRSTENPLSASIIPAQNIAGGTVVITLILRSEEHTSELQSH